jgi:transcriptional regulator with XRE-family HTH domain
MSIRKIMGRNIRDLRIQKGYSQKKLAEIARMNMVYIGSVERGERNITVENLDVIAKALKIPTHLLLIEDAFLVK